MTKLTVIDVGQGDSILIQHNGYKILVDGGPDNTSSSELSNRFLLNFCHIDIVFLTHPHADHLSGLNRILKWCEVESIVYHGHPYESGIYQKFLNLVVEKKIKVGGLTSNDEIKIGDLYIHILWPDESSLRKVQKNINLTSYVLLIDYLDQEAILTGDAEREVLDKLVSHPKLDLIDDGVEIYKVPHHGASNALSMDFLKKIDPKACVISVGMNKFGHPHEDVIEFLESIDCPILRTDEAGSIGGIF